jgi:hypothetical protein
LLFALNLVIPEQLSNYESRSVSNMAI